MRKLAEFIVDKRKFLLIIFIAAAIGSVIMSSHINVIQELTDYLPDDTETSIGLDVMDEQFTTFGTAKVMVQNVTYDQAKAIADQLKVKYPQSPFQGESSGKQAVCRCNRPERSGWS